MHAAWEPRTQLACCSRSLLPLVHFPEAAHAVWRVALLPPALPRPAFEAEGASQASAALVRAECTLCTLCNAGSPRCPACSPCRRYPRPRATAGAACGAGTTALRRCRRPSNGCRWRRPSDTSLLCFPAALHHLADSEEVVCRQGCAAKPGHRPPTPDNACTARPAAPRLWALPT